MRIGKNKKVELMSQAPLLSTCSKKDLSEIAMVADELDLPEGREMTREGEPGREFFVLLEGEATVKRKGRKIATLKGGDFFGEMALVDDRPRTATVVATTPVRALVLTDRAFRSLMKRSPTIQAKVLQAVVQRLGRDRLENCP